MQDNYINGFAYCMQAKSTKPGRGGAIQSILACAGVVWGRHYAGAAVYRAAPTVSEILTKPRIFLKIEGKKACLLP